MFTEKKFLPAKDVTPALITQWKQEHGKVFEYKSTDGKVGYFKMPDRQLMDASSAMANAHPVFSNEMLAKGCFLAGDEELISKNEYFFGLSQWLKKLLSIKEGELKEL
jgi:hypothetical protein